MSCWVSVRRCQPPDRPAGPAEQKMCRSPRFSCPGAGSALPHRLPDPRPGLLRPFRAHARRALGNGVQGKASLAGSQTLCFSDGYGLHTATLLLKQQPHVAEDQTPRRMPAARWAQRGCSRLRCGRCVVVGCSVSQREGGAGLLHGSCRYIAYWTYFFLTVIHGDPTVLEM